MNEYLYPHDNPREVDRLDALTRLLDPWTRFRLAAVDLPSDAVCLEVGAGLGTLSQWLAGERVRDGRVVATDIDIGFLSNRDWPTDNVEVRRVDIVADDLGEAAYDLIVARLVLVHLAQRRSILCKLVRSAKPGGAIYIEDADFFPTSAIDDPAIRRFWSEYDDFRTAVADDDNRIGRQMAPWLAELGCLDIDSTANVHWVRGGDPFALWVRETMALAGDRMLASGLISPASLTAFLDLCDDRDRWTMHMGLVSTTARTPI